jgi:predicted membrane chloride channel (bestrophin family)
MFNQTKGKGGICMDGACLEDTFGAQRPDSPSTLDYLQSESKEVGLTYTDGTATATDTVDQVNSVGTSSVTDNQASLDQNSSHEEVKRVLGSQHHYHPKSDGCIVGNIRDCRSVYNEQRPYKRRANRSTSQLGWNAPLSTWLMTRNMGMFALLVLYNLAVVLAAIFTPMCGNPREFDPFQFCDEAWVLVKGEVLNLIGISLAVFFSMRVFLSFIRFKEARGHLSKIGSLCASLVRQICFHTVLVHHKDSWERRRVVAFAKAFPITIKLQLRKHKNAIPDLSNILVHQDILNLMKAKSMPDFCLDSINFFVSEATALKRLSDLSQTSIQSCCLTPMSESMYALSYINATPMPTTYLFPIRFILISWLLLYPFHLIVSHGFMTVIFGFLIDYLFLSMDSMACEYDNPFGYERYDFDLDTFCNEVVEDLEDILARVEHQDRLLIFDTWEVARKNEEMIYRATAGELSMLSSASQRPERQSRAQFVRLATKEIENDSSPTEEESAITP